MLTYVCTWKNPHSWEAIPDNQEAHTPLPQSSSSSSSGTKMSCSSSSAAKFLLIWVPTYKKGTTTRAIRTRPKGVCFRAVSAHPTTETTKLVQEKQLVRGSFLLYLCEMLLVELSVYSACCVFMTRLSLRGNRTPFYLPCTRVMTEL